MRACQSCGNDIEGRRSDAQTCSPTCKERLKKQRQRGTVVDLPARPPKGDEEHPLVARLLRDLTDARRLDTTEGEHALFLTRRMVTPTADTASAVAALSKEAARARGEALKGAKLERTSLDELRARRDAKRGA
jgi:hypothetical protein